MPPTGYRRTVRRLAAAVAWPSAPACAPGNLSDPAGGCGIRGLTRPGHAPIVGVGHQVGAYPGRNRGRVPFQGRHVMVGDLMVPMAVGVPPPRSNTACLSPPTRPT